MDEDRVERGEGADGGAAACVGEVAAAGAGEGEVADVGEGADVGEVADVSAAVGEVANGGAHAQTPGGLSAGKAQVADAKSGSLTHVNERGEVRMVDVSDKDVTSRTAVAEGCIFMHPDTLAMISGGAAAKGDVLATARVAGVMAAKAASSIIPMCHPLNINKAEVRIDEIAPGERPDARVGLRVTTTTRVDGKTGVEMEALVAASVACLTVYDMCKAVDRGMEIGEIHLLRKEGGRSGLWLRD